MNFKSLSDEKFPKIYEYGLFIKFSMTLSGFMMIFIFSGWYISEFLNIYNKNQNFTIFLGFLLVSFIMFTILYAMRFPFVEKFFIYENKIVKKGVFSDNEIYFIDVEGYEKRRVVMISILDDYIEYSIISKNNKKIKLSSYLVKHEKIFKFVEENFEKLGETKNY